MSETSTFEIKSNEFLREAIHWLYCGNSKMQQTMPDAKMVIQLLHGMGFLIDSEPSPHEKPIVDRKGLIVEINNTNPRMKIKMIYPAPEKSSNGTSSSGSSSSAEIDHKPLIGNQNGINLPNLDEATKDVVREVVQILVEFMAEQDRYKATNTGEIDLRRCISLESLKDRIKRKMPPLTPKDIDKKFSIIEEEKMTLQNENGNATVSLEEETKDNEPLELKENLRPAPNSGKKVFSPIPDALHKIPLERQKTWVKEPVIGKPADSIICISTPKPSALQRKTDKAEDTCFLSPVGLRKYSADLSKIKPSCSRPETNIAKLSLPSISKSSTLKISCINSSTSISIRRSERITSKEVVNQRKLEVNLRDTKRQSPINKIPTDSSNLLSGENEVTPQKKRSPSSVMGRLFRVAGPSEAPASKKSHPSLLPRSNLPIVTAKQDKTQKKNVK